MRHAIKSSLPAFRLLAIFWLICLHCAAIAQTSSSAAASAATTTAPTAAEPTTVGKVELLEGDVKVFDKQLKARVVQVGDRMFEGDNIQTGADGELHFATEDGGFVAVRPNTRLRLTKYRAQGDEKDISVMSVLVGSLRVITGWIGKYNPRAYSIRTPNGTIGVRGTDHEPLVIAEGGADGEAGTYDKVNAGATYIQTAHGRIDIPERRAAFAPLAKGKGKGMVRPRLLDRVPGFYRSGRNEHLLERRHENIQRLLEQKREDRRRLIRERGELRSEAREARREQLRQRATDHEQRRQHLQQAREDRMQRRAEADRHGARRGEREERREERLQRRAERDEQRPRPRRERDD